MSKFTSLTVMVVLVMTASAEPVKLGLLSAEPPKTWLSENPANRLRSHQFRLKDDSGHDGEVIVSPEGNPNPEKVFPGWKGQFDVPEGKTVDDISTVSKLEVGPATVHLLDVSGTWNYKERPFDPKSKMEKRDEYRVIWAIVVVKDEATHVRMSGPASLVKTHYDPFIAWLKALKKS